MQGLKDGVVWLSASFHHPKRASTIDC